MNQYSEKYEDDTYEYRHVILSSDAYRRMPHGRLLSEKEWRDLGVQQSKRQLNNHFSLSHSFFFRCWLGPLCNTSTGTKDLTISTTQAAERNKPVILFLFIVVVVDIHGRRDYTTTRDC